MRRTPQKTYRLGKRTLERIEAIKRYTGQTATDVIVEGVRLAYEQVPPAYRKRAESLSADDRPVGL